MGRKPKISKPLKTSSASLAKFQNGMTTRDLEIITGWSRPTVRRRMLDPEFPPPFGKRGNQITYEALEVMEWLSRFNLRAILGDGYLEYERTLKDRSFADPRLTETRWRVIERENTRRARLADGLYGDMKLFSRQSDTPI